MRGVTARADSAEAYQLATLELHRMTLAIIEGEGLHAREPVQSPSKASGGVLAAGEQHQSTLITDQMILPGPWSSGGG